MAANRSVYYCSVILPSSQGRPADLKANYSSYAVFCTAKVPLETINDVLRKSQQGMALRGDDRYTIWLATNDLESDPASKVESREGTLPPVKSYDWHYEGRDLADLAATLQKVPQSAPLTASDFAVLDQRTIEDGSVKICHVNQDYQGGGVDFIRVWSLCTTATLVSSSMATPEFMDIKETYENRIKGKESDVIYYPDEKSYHK